MPQIQVECYWCQKPILRYPSQMNRGHQYCSMECRDKSRRRVPDRQCEQCGTTFRPPALGDNTRFCSRVCYRTWRASLTEYIDTQCRGCGKVFRRARKGYHTHWAEGRPVPRKYCSKACADKGRIGKWRGEDAAAWRGGTTTLQDIIRKSPGADALRREVFRRDGYCSVISGQRGRLVHHHLVAFSTLLSEYGITKDNWRDHAAILFDPGNAVTLQADEHRDFHATFGKVTTPEQFSEYMAAHRSRPLELDKCKTQPNA